jgi:hypothetical protein
MPACEGWRIPTKSIGYIHVKAIVNFQKLWYIWTMVANKELLVSSPAPAYRRELEYLYARRLAIDTLIESLQVYDRFRVIRTDESGRQTS